MQNRQQTFGPLRASAVLRNKTSLTYEHMMLYRLVRRWLFLGGLEPLEIESANAEPTSYPNAFRHLAKEAFGQQLDIRYVDHDDLEKMKAMIRERIATLQTSDRAANDWYPQGWREAMA